MQHWEVLIIDAHATFRRSAVQFIQEHCAEMLCVVGTSTASEQALLLAAELRPQIVLFGLQVIVLPDLSQIMKLRWLLPESGIIALGVLDIDDYRTVICAAGADGLIAKDSLKVSLVPTIEQVMHSYR